MIPDRLEDSSKNLVNKMPVNKDGNFTTVDGVLVRKLFVSNLPFNARRKHLFMAFNFYGSVKSVNMKKTNGSNPSKTTGFGFITFRTANEATRALKKRNNIFILNCKVNVFPADSWHQPLDLPNGEILWDRRHNNAHQNENSNVEEEGNIHRLVQQAIDTDSAISLLNEDCLLLIFDYLTLNERLLICNVCKKWKRLNLHTFKGIKTLNFSVPPLSDVTLSNKILKVYVTSFPNLTNLNISREGHQLTAETIIFIANHCRKLTSLDIRDVPLQRRSLAYLAKKCSHLKYFCMDASSAQHDSEMIALLKNSKTIEEINIKYSYSSVGVWLKFIQPPLRSLTMELYEFIPDYLRAGLENVKNSLKELRLVMCDSLRNQEIRDLADIIPGLSSLAIVGLFPDAHASSLLPITNLNKLTSLDLTSTGFVTDEFLSELSEKCCCLNFFNISGINERYLTVQGLNVLCKLTNLNHLTLSNLKKVNDELLKSLSMRIKNLNRLDVARCEGITDEGCRLVVKNCKVLEVLDVTACKLVTNFTVFTAIESRSINKLGKKLRIIAGESGIDLDMCWSPEVFVDPTSSNKTVYPDSLCILNDDFGFLSDEHDFDLLYDELNDFDTDFDQYYGDSDFDDDDDDEDDVDLFDYFDL